MISLQLREWTNVHRSVSEIADARLDQVFQALSSPARREILRLLLHQPLCVSDIVEHFQLAQPTISKHLSVLRQAGLVRSERQGQKVFYRTDTAAIAEALTEFMGQFRPPRSEPERTERRPPTASRRRASKTKLSSH